MSKKRIIKLALILICLLLVIVGYIAYNNFKPREVVVNYHNNEGTRIAIYEPSDVDEHGDALSGTEEPITVISSSTTIKLRPGTYYVALYEESENFLDFSESLRVLRSDDNNLDVKINLSDKAIKELLLKEKAGISFAIINHFKSYDKQRNSINSIQIHGGGDYASAVITTTRYKDYFHVVLQKEDDSSEWKVLTEPKVVLNVVEYPNIPREILVELNKNQFKATGERL